MAKYEEGINGPFYGKVGKVIGSSWRGVNFMKSPPDFITAEPTAGQRRQRSKLGLVSNWLKPLKALIEIGYQSVTTAKTPMNAAISLVMKTALIGDGGDLRIDFSRVVFSRGELVASFIYEVEMSEDGILHLKWRNVGASSLCSDDDRATFIIYHPGSDKFFTFQHVALREDQQVELELPGIVTDDALHCWMYYVSQKGEAVSTSIYITI